MKITDAEMKILQAGLRLLTSGTPQFTGFQIADEIAKQEEKYRLMGFGTLYRALSRLVDAGRLSSRWEVLPIEEKRPRCRYYRLTEVEILK